MSSNGIGPWRISDAQPGMVVDERDQPVARLHWQGKKASNIARANRNRLAIIAAPEGLEVAVFVYEALLRHPVDAWRIRADGQKSLCLLRGFIAKATGRSEQEVQEFHEGVVAGELECAT
ncbi:hypothetical protein [Stenotrophomonas sp. AB1(2024)]|uniref:hypothetical protein n=1 Tax=Stenotrophomonas sp. AB1(2024) TaxID=3132215 RepID=UPI0030B2DB98